MAAGWVAGADGPAGIAGSVSNWLRTRVLSGFRNQWSPISITQRKMFSNRPNVGILLEQMRNEK